LRAAPEMAFGLAGPFAAGLERESENLVTRARDLLIDAAPSPPDRFELVLDKRLPIAAGLGGGSADAAAALLLINDHFAATGLSALDPGDLAAIARRLGADVTACLSSRTLIGLGRGDDVRPAPPMPVLHAVLVNPGAASSTGAVYRAFDEQPPGPGANEPTCPAGFASVGDVVGFLDATRNDLERPAVTLQPLIGEVLSALDRAPQALFSRMSGSGATCFALCESVAAADCLASEISAAHPGWWVQACRFGAFG